MIDLIKFKIKLLLVPTLYFSTFAVMGYSIFKRAEVALWLLVFIIPQPNLWHKFYDFPLGSQIIDLLFVSVLLGGLLQSRFTLFHRNSFIIFLFVLITYLALWNGAFRFSLPLPISTANSYIYEFKNYVQMILFYFLVASLVKTKEQQNFLLLLITLALFIVFLRSYRNFNPGTMFDYSKRASGPFWIVGLGANHWGAFALDYATVIFGLIYYETNKKKRIFYIITCLFALHPIFFTYSRGVYLATLCMLILFAVVKDKRIFIFLLMLTLGWQVILPPSVVDRITMTQNKETGEIENSAGGRLEMWGMAFQLFTEHPVTGAGYDAFARTYGGQMTEGGRLAKNQDVHNFFMRTLCDQGIIGFFVFIVLLFRAFGSGRTLYKQAVTKQQKALGLGFMGCVVTITVTNLFGDRWSYFVLGSFFWCFWGLVDSNIENIIMQRKGSNRSVSGADGHVENSLPNNTLQARAVVN